MGNDTVAVCSVEPGLRFPRVARTGLGPSRERPRFSNWNATPSPSRSKPTNRSEKRCPRVRGEEGWIDCRHIIGSVVRKPSGVTHDRFRDELRLITMNRNVMCGCGHRGRRGVGNRGRRGGGRGMAVGRCRARASSWYRDGVDWTSLGSAWRGLDLEQAQKKSEYCECT